MNFSSSASTRTHAMTFIACLSFVYVTMSMFTVTTADEGSDKANGMLDRLKQRSPDERWQRVKKLYPSDPPVVRRSTPARLPGDQHPALPEDEVPPSPGQTPLIPRLSAAPTDHSDDWILPVRRPVPVGEEVVPTLVPNSIGANDAEMIDLPSPRPEKRIAIQNTDPKPLDVKTGISPKRSLRERKISDIDPVYDRDRDTDIREFAIEKGKEFDIFFQAKPFADRSFPEVTLAWEASNFFYHPLYFADPALERYGHSYHPVIQPIASIARAGVQFVFLPYQMTISPICKEEYPLGWHRPGDCVDKLHYQPPLNAQAAVVEAAVVTGLFFIIP